MDSRSWSPPLWNRCILGTLITHVRHTHAIVRSAGIGRLTCGWVVVWDVTWMCTCDLLYMQWATAPCLQIPWKSHASKLTLFQGTAYYYKLNLPMWANCTAWTPLAQELSIYDITVAAGGMHKHRMSQSVCQTRKYCCELHHSAMLPINLAQSTPPAQ